MPDEANPSPGKPKGLIIDRKFSQDELKIPRNQQYVRDLGQCFKTFQKWGYDIVWVESGIDALRAIRRYGEDVKCVLIEVYVPGGGFTVARLIRFKPDCTHIPVFLMSNQLTEKDLIEGKRIGVIECMSRPFQQQEAVEQLLVKGKVAAEEAEAGPPVDPKAHILAELEKITGLPAMPTVYNEIEKLSKDPNTTSEQYASVIEMDPAITTQMLRLCNSSAFSFSRKISTVQDAVNLLGLQTVIDFVRTLSVVGAFKGSASGFDAEEFWKHSIGVGVTGKLLGERDEIKSILKLGEEDPFMAGMVHDIGKQVLGHFFNDMYKMVQDEIRNSGSTMLAVETDVLGITHEDIGLALATKWQLPDMLMAVIGLHHKPGDPDAGEMVHLIHFANICAKAAGFVFEEKESENPVAEATLEKLGMDAEAMGALTKEIEPTLRTQVNDTFSAIFKG